MNAGRTHPDEQMLASADYFLDRLPGKVHGGVAGDPDVAPGQLLARQRRAQFRGRAEHGVAFRHQRSRSPRGVLANPACVSAVATTESRSSNTATPSTRSTSSAGTCRRVTSSANATAAA